MELDEEEYLHSMLRKKGKSQTFLIRPDVLDLKPRNRRHGKCLGAAQEVLESEQQFHAGMDTATEKPEEYNYIINDVWFHLANYIAPEDVQRYALVCTQSAGSTGSQTFWLNLYRKYCQKSKDKKKWVQELPSHLQMNQLIGCDMNTLRQNVIQALFYCHQPFTDINRKYSLNMLKGRYYVSCWHLRKQCFWIMCYKFRFKCTPRNAGVCTRSSVQEYCKQQEGEVYEDWESLLDEQCSQNVRNDKNKSFLSQKSKAVKDNCDGVTLLLICCNKFVPFPSEFLCVNSTYSVRLADTRKLLASDMRSTNLEIDLVASRSNECITWKYNNVLNWKVLPWWHPEFSTFNKCEESNESTFGAEDRSS